MKKLQCSFRVKARISHDAPPFLNLPSATSTKRWPGDVAPLICSGPSCPHMVFAWGRLSGRSTLPIFLTLPSLLECWQEVLHHPDLDLVLALTRAESEVVTVRAKRNVAHRIH